MEQETIVCPATVKQEEDAFIAGHQYHNLFCFPVVGKSQLPKDYKKKNKPRVEEQLKMNEKARQQRPQARLMAKPAPRLVGKSCYRSSVEPQKFYICTQWPTSHVQDITRQQLL